MSENIIKVITVDDHEVVRAGFRHLLHTTEDIRVIAEAKSGEEAIRLTKLHQPDVVVMDINMPGMGGIEAISRIVSAYPNINIIALTVHESEPFPTQVFNAGGKAYLSKRCAPTELVKAVREIAVGRQYISATVRAGIARGKRMHNPFENLTAREFQVFDLMAQGLNMHDVSDALHLSYKTIHTHRTKVMKKLGLKSHLDIVKFARRYNIVD